MPSGSEVAAQAAPASSPIVLRRSGEPLTCQPPSVHSMSSGAHSSRCAAIWRALLLDLVWSCTSAVPSTASEREPYVPSP